MTLRLGPSRRRAIGASAVGSGNLGSDVPLICTGA